VTKELWIDAYTEKYDECIEEGMTEKEADKKSVEWAEGAFERAMDAADNLRKAAKE